MTWLLYHRKLRKIMEELKKEETNPESGDDEFSNDKSLDPGITAIYSLETLARNIITTLADIAKGRPQC